MTAGLIPRNRLARIPGSCRLAHEYCYFLHDQCVRVLVEYEAARAATVTVKFRNAGERKTFTTPGMHAIDALRAMRREDAARRVVLNTVTMAMVSDAMMHIFEALKCLEKRKTIVALNLLRKPLTDSLVFLSWMYGDEDGFYAAFTAGDVETLSANKLGNHRRSIIKMAAGDLPNSDAFDPDWIWTALFDSKDPGGLYGLFQKAVHLVTVQKVELKTEPENFNFIFKNPSDNDIYLSAYWHLPRLLHYLSHVAMGLFERIHPMDPGARRAFEVRSGFGLNLVEGGEAERDARLRLQAALGPVLTCADCGAPPRFTSHNAARLTLSESYRCTGCRRIHGFPFSWIF